MDFSFGYRLTYENGQTNSSGRDTLYLKTTDEEAKRIIAGTLQGIPLGEIPNISDCIDRMKELVVWSDRAYNTNGTRRNSLLKKPRSIKSIECFLSEADVKRIKSLPNAVGAVEKPKEHMVITRSDGTTLELSYFFGTVTVTDNKKHQTFSMSADDFSDEIVY